MTIPGFYGALGLGMGLGALLMAIIFGLMDMVRKSKAGQDDPEPLSGGQKEWHAWAPKANPPGSDGGLKREWEDGAGCR